MTLQFHPRATRHVDQPGDPAGGPADPGGRYMPTALRVPAPAAGDGRFTWLGRRWTKASKFFPFLTVFAVPGSVAIVTFWLQIPVWVPAVLTFWLPVAALLGTVGEFPSSGKSAFDPLMRVYVIAVAAIGPGYITWCNLGDADGIVRWNLLVTDVRFTASPLRLQETMVLLVLSICALGAWVTVKKMQLDREEDERMRLSYQAYLAERRARTPAPQPDPGPTDPAARRLLEIFQENGVDGVRFHQRRQFPNGMLGFAFRLPDNGKVTYSRIVNLKDNIETAGGLPVGAVGFDYGRKRTPNGAKKRVTNYFWVYIGVEDILATTLSDEYAGDEPLSIHNAFVLGKWADGTLFTLRLREVVLLIIAMRRRGKSNLLHLLLERLTRCEDAWVAVIDLKGGRVGIPWVYAWLQRWRHPDPELARQGHQVRPGLGWLATTHREAFYVVHAFNAAIAHRASDGVDKVEPSPDRPAMVLVCDELALLVGGHNTAKSSLDGFTAGQYGDELTTVVTTGGELAVDVIVASQRGTSDMAGPTSFLSQFPYRIGMGFADDNEARYVHGSLSPQQVEITTKMEGEATRGTFLATGDPDWRPLGGKFFKCADPLREIPYVAYRHAYLWPDVDQGAADAMDVALRRLTGWRDDAGVFHLGPHGFHDRWDDYDRIKHLLKKSERRAEDLVDDGKMPLPALWKALGLNPGGIAPANASDQVKEIARVLGHAARSYPPAEPVSASVMAASAVPGTAAAATVAAAAPTRSGDHPRIESVDPFDECDRIAFGGVTQADVDADFDNLVQAERDIAEVLVDIANAGGTDAGGPDGDPGDDGDLPADKATQFNFMVEFVTARRRKGATAGQVIAAMRTKFRNDCVHQSTIYHWLNRATCYRNTKPGKPHLDQPVAGGSFFGLGYGR